MSYEIVFNSDSQTQEELENEPVYVAPDQNDLDDVCKNFELPCDPHRRTLSSVINVGTTQASINNIIKESEKIIADAQHLRKNIINMAVEASPEEAPNE